MTIKPTQWPSGEKNGAPPLETSLTRLDSSSASDRRKNASALRPPRPALNARRLPSGEIAMRFWKLGTNTPSSGATMANCVRLRGTEPRYLVLTMAPVVAAPATAPAMALIAARRVMRGCWPRTRSPCSGLAIASSRSIRTSPASRSRLLGSFSRQRRSSRRTAEGVASGMPVPRRLAFKDRRDGVRHRVACKRLPAGEHFKEHASKRPDVGALVYRLDHALVRDSCRQPCRGPRPSRAAPS